MALIIALIFLSFWCIFNVRKEEEEMMRLLAIFIFSLAVSLAGVAEVATYSGLVVEVEGKVDVRDVKGEWQPVKTDMTLKEGDIIRTGPGSWAILKLSGAKGGDISIKVKENSQLRLAELFEDKKEGVQKTLLDLAIGEILVKAEKLTSEKSSLDVKTPTSIVGVRGTKFTITVEAIE